jgi:hypothetical protein
MNARFNATNAAGTPSTTMNEDNDLIATILRHIASAYPTLVRQKLHNAYPTYQFDRHKNDPIYKSLHFQLLGADTKVGIAYKQRPGLRKIGSVYSKPTIAVSVDLTDPNSLDVILHHFANWIIQNKSVTEKWVPPSQRVK